MKSWLSNMAERKQMMRTRSIASSKRRKREIDSPHLPEEIIFNILSWLPAEFLHDIGKYVCKTWADTIRDPLFIKRHLLHSNSGLFIQDRCRPLNVRFLEAKEGKVNMTHLNRHFSAEILATCEGVSLFLTEDFHDLMLYVANCVTMKVLKLPCVPSPVRLPDLVLCRIERIPDTGAFKVISPFQDLDGFYHWHVLTVGTDMSWRKIYCGLTEVEFDLYMQRTVSFCGVIYFAKGSWMEDGSRILAVDICDESIHYIRVPDEYLIKENYYPKAYGLLQMGNYLSCLVFDKKGWTEVNVCILKDVYSSEWVKFRKIHVNVGCAIWDRSYRPYAWLDNGRVLIFANRKLLKSGELRMRLVAYNVETGVMRNIRNVETVKSHFVLVHKNSLVSW